MEPVRSSICLAALPSEEVKALVVSNLVRTRQKHIVEGSHLRKLISQVQTCMKS